MYMYNSGYYYIHDRKNIPLTGTSVSMSDITHTDHEDWDDSSYTTSATPQAYGHYGYDYDSYDYDYYGYHGGNMYHASNSGKYNSKINASPPVSVSLILNYSFTLRF